MMGCKALALIRFIHVNFVDWNQVFFVQTSLWYCNIYSAQVQAVLFKGCRVCLHHYDLTLIGILPNLMAKPLL